MDFRPALGTLFRETFEGVAPGADGTFYVQGREAFLPILAALTAEQASARPNDRLNSIAGHVIHATYYIDLLNQVFDGVEPEIDWESSWARQNVSEAEWELAQAEMARAYRQLAATMETAEPQNDEHMTYLLAQLAHAAFHLGSVRQMAWTLVPDLAV